MPSQKGSHQTYMKTCSQPCSKQPKKQILINILVAMAMKATRPLATYPMIFTKVLATASIMLIVIFALLPLLSNWGIQKQPLAMLLPVSPTEHCTMPKQAL